MTMYNSDQNRNPLPIESSDDIALRMFKGARFAPSAKLTLPSGTELSGDEAQVFIAAFNDDGPVRITPEVMEPSTEGINYWDNPLASEFDNWSNDPRVNSRSLEQRALDAIYAPQPPLGFVIQEFLQAECAQDLHTTHRKIDAVRRFFKRMTE